LPLPPFPTRRSSDLPYLELATIAETLGTPERVAYASDQFIHDLAVWYHLAWLGESVRRTDPLVARLTERGRDFSPTQRRDLLTLDRKSTRLNSSHLG